MNAAALARNAYRTSTRSTATPRVIELQLLSEINGALAQSEKNMTADYPAHIDALSRNLQFWTIVAADVARKDNKLPSQLKAQIFYLFEFVKDHTHKIFNRSPDAAARALIDINNNIIDGLKRSAA